MDEIKCRALKAELEAQGEPYLTPGQRFFDGNDDEGSIGCNLYEHPGVETFRETFAGLLRRPDVEAIYMRISELDPGEGCWPFTDTVFIAGSIPVEELREAVNVLQPDEVGDAEPFGIPVTIHEKHNAPWLAIWWD